MEEMIGVVAERGLECSAEVAKTRDKMEPREEVVLVQVEEELVVAGNNWPYQIE